VIQEPREKHARKKGRKVGNHFGNLFNKQNTVEFENILSKDALSFHELTTFSFY
jgi:hypothetical protein